MSPESEYVHFRNGAFTERPIFGPKQVFSQTELLPGKKYIWHLGIVESVVKDGHHVGEMIDHAKEFFVMQFATKGEEQFVLIQTINRGQSYETWVDLIGLGLAPYPTGEWSGWAWVEDPNRQL